MQDRFKFRVWNKAKNKFEQDRETFIMSNGELVFMDEACRCFPKNNPNYIISFCTGLKDKNGKLIFEGDIVTVACGHFVIKYCDVCKSFQCFCDDECFACNGDYHWFEFLDDEREIIGNIHENPNFLEW